MASWLVAKLPGGEMTGKREISPYLGFLSISNRFL